MGALDSRPGDAFVGTDAPPPPPDGESPDLGRDAPPPPPACTTAADCPAPSLPCAVVACDPRSGTCRESPPDADADGHGDANCPVSTALLPNDDCDDTDNTRFPGNRETCDTFGHDEDCDFRTVGDDRDEDMDGQVPIECSNLDDATGEVIYGADCDDQNAQVMAGMIADGPTLNCDGADNDCDGQIDLGCACSPAGLLRECGVQSGAMGACGAGLQTCAGGAWGDCVGATAPSAERCDPPGVDEDCDGAVDDGCEGCVPGEMRACGGGMFNGGTAACRPGTQQCTARGTWGGCDGAVGPRPERCDGTDDDCDGMVDEEPEAGASCLVEGAETACRLGRCEVTACPPGLDDCDDDFSTACEEMLATSARHCGRCGNACAASEECVGGVCDPVVQISGGASHVCATRHGGRVLCWGSDFGGELGIPTPGDSPTPVEVTSLGDAVEVCAGAAHSCARRLTGDVSCWGNNLFGQIGNGTLGAGTDSRVPVPVTGVAGVVELACGGTSTCARTTGGEVWCWGDGESGQLGDGMSGDGHFVPRAAPVIGLGVASTVALGHHHACAAVLGRAWCWGDNGTGQVGIGMPPDIVVMPTMVEAGDMVMELALGYHHSLALGAGEGLVRAWGGNAGGELGDGTRDDRRTPVALSLGSLVTQVAAGVSHSCARLATGSVICWGDGAVGQLGDARSGAGVIALSPVTVMGLSDATHVTSGWDYNCALRATGSVVCWGANARGQLGDGTMDMRTTPTPVVGLP